MKKIVSFCSYYFLLLLLLSFTGCQDKVFQTYKVSKPVYMSYDDLRSGVEVTAPTEIDEPGKIYIKDHYIFLNEVRKGIHIINNEDPGNPHIIKFIEIPGNVDMAVKENILYADSYVDLVALDISNLEDIKEVARFKDMFNYSIPPILENTTMGLVDPQKGVVIHWSEEEVTVESPTPTYYPTLWRGGMLLFEDALNVANGESANGNTGTGGSMARFIIHNDILYTIDIMDLILFDVTNSLDPKSLGKFSVGWNIETVFIANENLFVGSQNGMYIYSLTDPVNPQWVSTYWHRSSCDPVVVQDDYAYVTLRTGTFCPSDVNQLDVVDLHDIAGPELLKSYPMFNPHGLGIDDHILFICDGDAGLKIFDAEDPLNITSHELAHFKDINTYDVIPTGNILLMIGNDGLYQYDYSDIQHIKLLSKLNINED
jgi:hypothetical protein